MNVVLLVRVSTDRTNAVLPSTELEYLQHLRQQSEWRKKD